jgi:S1-C subfamily serine protease
MAACGRAAAPPASPAPPGDPPASLAPPAAAGPDGPDATRPDAPDSPRATAPPPIAPLSADRTAQAGPPLVGAGTCFAISRDGLVVTAAGVVDGADVIGVQFGDEPPRPATVTRRSGDVDLAVLATDRVATAFLPIELAPRLAVGDRIFTIGFQRPAAAGAEPAFVDGAVSALTSGGEDRLLQLSLATQGGNAGGAVVREDGALVGIVVRRTGDGVYLQRTGAVSADATVATRAAYLVPLVDPSRLAKPARLDRAAAIKRLQAATCKVLTARSRP